MIAETNPGPRQQLAPARRPGGEDDPNHVAVTRATAASKSRANSRLHASTATPPPVDRCRPFAHKPFMAAPRPRPTTERGNRARPTPPPRPRQVPRPRRDRARHDAQQQRVDRRPPPPPPTTHTGATGHCCAGRDHDGEHHLERRPDHHGRPGGPGTLPASWGLTTHGQRQQHRRPPARIRAAAGDAARGSRRCPCSRTRPRPSPSRTIADAPEADQHAAAPRPWLLAPRARPRPRRGPPPPPGSALRPAGRRGSDAAGVPGQRRHRGGHHRGRHRPPGRG
jgi:hypothetical protein